MEVTMPQNLLASLLADAAEMGANNALAKAGLLKPYMSKADAYRKYGTRTVQRWLKEGRIQLKKSSPGATKLMIERSQIEAVEKSTNKPVYNQITTH